MAFEPGSRKVICELMEPNPLFDCALGAVGLTGSLRSSSRTHPMSLSGCGASGAEKTRGDFKHSEAMEDIKRPADIDDNLRLMPSNPGQPQRSQP